MRRGHPQGETKICSFASELPSSLLSCRSALHHISKCCSSLLSTSEARSSGWRSPVGSTTLYVWINHREIVRRSSFEGLVDLFVGSHTDQICSADCTTSILPNSPSTSSAA